MICLLNLSNDDSTFSELNRQSTISTEASVESQGIEISKARLIEVIDELSLTFKDLVQTSKLMPIALGETQINYSAVGLLGTVLMKMLKMTDSALKQVRKNRKCPVLFK